MGWTGASTYENVQVCELLQAIVSGDQNTTEAGWNTHKDRLHDLQRDGSLGHVCDRPALDSPVSRCGGVGVEKEGYR